MDRNIRHIQCEQNTGISPISNSRYRHTQLSVLPEFAATINDSTIQCHSLRSVTVHRNINLKAICLFRI
jgi:hypothetical protein